MCGRLGSVDASAKGCCGIVQMVSAKDGTHTVLAVMQRWARTSGRGLIKGRLRWLGSGAVPSGRGVIQGPRRVCRFAEPSCRA